MTLDKTAFGQYSTELFTEEAEKIISEHDTKKVLSFPKKIQYLQDLLQGWVNRIQESYLCVIIVADFSRILYYICETNCAHDSFSRLFF